jgi:hypothetical protein
VAGVGKEPLKSLEVYEQRRFIVIDITLTDLFNIVQSTGMTKLSKIRKIKTREYSPASDYYKSLREAIIEVLSSNGLAGLQNMVAHKV